MKLYIDPADGPPFERLLDRDSMVIGRSSASDLSLPDPFLSRHHARLFREGDKYYLEDLGSRNGTFLNGVAVTSPTAIEEGDEIKVSGSVIRVHPRDASLSGELDPITDMGATIFRPVSDFLGAESRSDPSEVEGEKALRNYAERLKLFNEIHEALGQPISLEELLSLILERAFEHLGPEQGVLFLDRGKGEFERAAQKSATGTVDLPLSRSLIEEVCVKGMAALVLDAATDARFAQSESIIMSGVRSLIAAPLGDEDRSDRSLGMIVLSTRAGAQQFSESDLEFLVSMASVAAMKVRNAALAEEALERRRLEDQLAVARRIQVSLLPDRLPEVQTLSLWAENLPSRGVSGDYYVASVRDPDELVVMMADVSGKGMPASLLTFSLEALAAAPIEDGSPVDEICRKVATRLYARTPPEKYATVFVATYRPEEGKLRYTNAGHNPALLVRADGEVETLGPTGPPVGLLPESAYTSAEVTVGAGDTVVLYTDGITEAENPDEEEYGMARLTEVAREHRHEDLQKLADSIHQDLEDFVQDVPFADDRTLFLIRRES